MHPRHREIKGHVTSARTGLPADHPAQPHLKAALRHLDNGDAKSAKRELTLAKAKAHSMAESDSQLKAGDHVKIAGKRHRIVAIKGDKALTRPEGVKQPFAMHSLSALRLAEDAKDGDPKSLHVNYADTLDRAKNMRLGETIRMPDGHAIKHHATEDGRPVWSAQRPSTWRDGQLESLATHPTAEGAVKEAMRSSLRSNDPASLGGPRRIHRGDVVRHGSKQVRVHEVEPSGKVLVKDITGSDQPGSVKPVKPSELKAPDDIMQESLIDSMLQERKHQSVIERLAGKGGPSDTFDHHSSKGKLSKSRASTHVQLIRHLMQNPEAHNSGPVAMVATYSRGGGPVHTVKNAAAPIPHGAVHVSIPALREALPEHAALKAHPTADENKLTDREARQLAKAAATVALTRGKPVVVHDGTATR